MYPTLTWQQEALALINANYGVDLSAQDNLTFTPITYGPSGTFTFEFFAADGGQYYTDETMELSYLRRDIGRLFVNFTPRVTGATGNTVGECVTALFARYGLAIDPSIFDADDLAAVIEMGDDGTSDNAIDVVNESSELWFGTLSFMVVKEGTDIASVYKTTAPLVATYPEGTQGKFQAFDTYGIVLRDTIDSDVGLLNDGDDLSSPGLGSAAFELANTLIQLDFPQAWNLITNCTVVYNGPIASYVGTDPDPTLLPAFGTEVLILKPNASLGLSTHFYFNY